MVYAEHFHVPLPSIIRAMGMGGGGNRKRKKKKEKKRSDVTAHSGDDV